MGRRPRRAAGVVAALLLAVVCVASSSGASAATGPKTYGVTSAPAAIGTTPTAASITFTNTSRNDIAFGAIDVTVPTPVTVAPASLSSTNGSTPVLLGNVIQMRNLTVGSGRAVTLSFSASAVLQAVCSAVDFVSEVRQANSFNGLNNTFTLTGSDARFALPCSSSRVTCTAGDGQACSTETIFSLNGNSADVTLDDGDEVSAVLEASLGARTLSCPEYAATSDELRFDVTISAGSVEGVTKVVTFRQPRPLGDTREASEYQVCFAAPYEFPALLPSQLVEDTNNGDFSGNTTFDPATGEHRGLLLHCGLDQGVPCVEHRAFDGPFVTVTVRTPALDPGMIF